LDVIEIGTVKSLFGLNDTAFSTSIVITTFAGQYGLPYRTYRAQHRLMSVHQAVDLAEQIYGPLHGLTAVADRIYRAKVAAYGRRFVRVRQRINAGLPPGRQPSFPHHWVDYLNAARPNWNFLCTTRLPVFSDLRTGQKAEIRFCLGCASELAIFTNRPGPRPANYAAVHAVLKGNASRAHDAASMNWHVENCAGVARLIALGA
jgi:hypothetical protein